MTKKRDFRLDIGDSTEGQVGLVAYVKAADRTDALHRIREVLSGPVSVKIDGFGEVITYVNPEAISLKAIEELEPEEEAAEDCSEQSAAVAQPPAEDFVVGTRTGAIFREFWRDGNIVSLWLPRIQINGKMHCLHDPAFVNGTAGFADKAVALAYARKTRDDMLARQRISD